MTIELKQLRGYELACLLVSTPVNPKHYHLLDFSAQDNLPV